MSAARAPGRTRLLLPAVAALLAACMSTAPAALRTGDVGPAAEGRLLVIEGRLTQPPFDDRPWGWKLHVDDGSGPLLVFVTPESQVEVAGLAAGERLRVTGRLGRYEQHLELLPRTPADLQRLP